MKIKFLVFIIFTSLSNLTYGQSKSLRELLLEANIVAITENFPDPFYPNEQKISISDHETLTLVDSVRIISYLKKVKIDLSNQKLVIKSNLANGFFDNLRKPELVEPISPYSKPPIYKTILFANTQKDFTEVLYFKEMNEQNFENIENFILWIDTIKKLKNEEEKCKQYISKYLSMLESNNVSKGFLFFENILLPTSNFMIYYKIKSPKATILTTEQKERFKNYVFNDDYFSNIDNTKLVYAFYPAETLEFYKEKLSEIRTYDEEFENNSGKYNEFLEFVLKSTNKWNKDTELLLELIDDYYSNNKSLKRDTFERLVEKINEK